ncbi:MAG: acetyl-CoA C-acyltransferase [Kineosporiaceae bacterium]|nr:acetyl-CoA C-acyltransferase [Kineosporiaceae bacterium]
MSPGDVVRPLDPTNPSVILAGARTPIGRFLGGLSSLDATALGGVAIRAALERAGVAADQVDAVVMGQVLTAGAGQIPARQAAAAGGIPLTVPATTVNKVCLSGTAAIALADQWIRLGEAEIVVAGGMESMSRAPHLVPASRRGQTFGDWTLTDHMERDGLWDSFTDLGMGPLAESGNVGEAAVSRAAQDAAAAASHQRAARAWTDGVMAAEVVAVPVPQRRGEPVLLAQDEGIRADTTIEALARLRPAFVDGGTITAGTASQISDGAAALVITSRRRAEREGWPWLAEIVSYASVAGPDSTLQVQPAKAIRTACARVGLAPADLELVEINEAFAAVSVAAANLLGLDPDRVNVDGGAIALGHPIGASGARITLHLAHALARRAHSGGDSTGDSGEIYGAAALCGGGGQGDAIVLRAKGIGR